MKTAWKKRMVARVLRYSGSGFFHGRARRGGLVVLTFHRVLPAEEIRRIPWDCNIFEKETFRHVMAFISNYPIIDLQEGINRLASSHKERRQAWVAVTFDDGFRDFYVHAFPILLALKIPTTLFLTSGPVHNGRGFWWDEIAERLWDQPFLVAAIPRLQNEFPAFCGEIAEFARTRDKKRWDGLQRGIRCFPPVARNLFLEEVVGHVPIKNDGRHRGTVSVEQVREMARAGIAIQSHTVTHPYLNELELNELRRELEESKEAISSWTGEPVDLLAYPAGRVPMGNGMDVVRRIYRGALTTRPGNNGAGEDPYRIKRKDASYLLDGDGFDPILATMEINGALDRFLGRYE